MKRLQDKKTARVEVFLLAYCCMSTLPLKIDQPPLFFSLQTLYHRRHFGSYLHLYTMTSYNNPFRDTVSSSSGTSTNPSTDQPSHAGSAFTVGSDVGNDASIWGSSASVPPSTIAVNSGQYDSPFASLTPVEQHGVQEGHVGNLMWFQCSRSERTLTYSMHFARCMRRRPISRFYYVIQQPAKQGKPTRASTTGSVSYRVHKYDVATDDWLWPTIATQTRDPGHRLSAQGQHRHSLRGRG